MATVDVTCTVDDCSNNGIPIAIETEWDDFDGHHETSTVQCGGIRDDASCGAVLWSAADQPDPQE